MMKPLYDLQAGKVKKTELSKAFRAQLSENFDHEITRLEVLLGRDFSHWRI